MATYLLLCTELFAVTALDDRKQGAPVRHGLPSRRPDSSLWRQPIKEECLSRIVPSGERHLRRALAEYVTHYHGERNHQGLGNELIDCPAIQRTRGSVRRRQRMGAILSHYYRSAA